MVRQISGHENYEVDDLGNVYSLNYNHTNKRKALKQNMTGHGYLQVCLDGKWVSVHRLVAYAFIDNPDQKRTVNHINCNRSDNRAANLEWATQSENIMHGIMYGKIKPRSGQESCLSKFKNEDILNIRRMHERGLTHSEISKKYKVNQSTITRIINKKTWRHL